VLTQVARRFLRVPRESLTVEKEIEVHLLNVYTLYIPRQIALFILAARGASARTASDPMAAPAASASPQVTAAPPQVVEFCGKWPYDNPADEFVRLVAVSEPAGGEVSGPTAHFLFGAKSGPDPNPQPGADTPAARPLKHRGPRRRVFVAGVVKRGLPGRI
jgi:hypothetical protein